MLPRGVSIAFLLLLLSGTMQAGNFFVADTSGTDDSTRTAFTEQILKRDRDSRPPRQYIRPCIFLNRYATGKRPLPPFKTGSLLKDYRFRQINTGFYFPIIPAITKYASDSVSLRTFNLLMTGNFQSAKPVFSGLNDQHVLYKNGIGLRAIYGNGRKDVFFWEVFLYATGDRMSDQTRRGYMMTNLIWSHTINDMWGYRFGVTRTYFIGNRYLLPVVGFRFGPLDKHYISFQFPRSITIWQSLPKGKGGISLYMKPFGGVYTMSNREGLYLGPDSVITFGRSEFLYGLQLDFTPTKNFSFFISPGFSARFLFKKYANGIAFFSDSYNEHERIKHPFRPLAPFYGQQFKEPTAFLNFGMSFRFGKTKRIAGNRQMYDIMDLNDSYDPGGNNDHPAGSTIPSDSWKNDTQKLKYKDIEDLLDVDDLQ